MPANADQRALAALLLGAVAIGLAPIFVRVADVGYTAAAFWRLLIAIPPLWLLARRESRHDKRPPPWRLWLLAGVFFALDLGAWHQSIRLTTVANATLLANLAPVFVALGAFLLFGERSGRGFLLGLAVALVGAGLLAADSLQLSADRAAGDALGVLTAVFYAGYILSVSRARRLGGALNLMLWTTVISAIALLPPALLIDGEQFWPASSRGWLVLAGLALISHVGGQGLIAHAMAHLPAAFSSVSLLVQPVAAALFAWALLGEAVGGLQSAGAAFVIAGIVVCRRNTPGLASRRPDKT